MKTVRLNSPHGVIQAQVSNGHEGEIVGWDDQSNKPLVRFQNEETQVIMAVPIHWLAAPAPSRFEVVERQHLPVLR